ncbi:MAG: hypothetical protein Q8N63_00665 [Nanoarchaeota archaeon]|nr:hypothetical protein [Nanoarchaeota archaeon]
MKTEMDSAKEDFKLSYYFSGGIFAGVLLATLFGIIPLKSRQIDPRVTPILRDINKDGLEDVVLKLRSGEDLVLYRTDNGYQFQNRGEK